MNYWMDFNFITFFIFTQIFGTINILENIHQKLAFFSYHMLKKALNIAKKINNIAYISQTKRVSL